MDWAFGTKLIGVRHFQETPTGLYVSLTTFLGFGQDYVEGYYRKTGNAVFLHIFREKIELPNSEPATDGPTEKKITRLAIGVEGGFDPEANKKKYEYKDHLSIVVFPDATKVPYPNLDFPLVVRRNDQRFELFGIIVTHQQSISGDDFSRKYPFGRIGHSKIGERITDWDVGW